MENSLHLRLVTADEVLLEKDIYSVTTKNTGGEFEILPDHSPFITLTVPSKTVIRDLDGNTLTLFTSGGLMRVLKNSVIFITDSAEFRENIDRERAEEALRNAKENLNNGSEFENEKTREAYERAKERLRTLDSE